MESTIEHGVDVRGTLAGLDRIAAGMAEATVPYLRSVTPELYTSILSLCYHYTRASGAQLERTAALAPDEELREFFASMSDEERDHFRLAEADLAALGGAVHPGRPTAVERFAEYWDGIAARTTSSSWGRPTSWRTLPACCGSTRSGCSPQWD